ncbi:hypothetical protein BD311DRAFT_722777 [Dichomitus squalens]|uniref:F-box domain-containing protein n=1 Tax=Dichomitus squalens TaxID=114155 RepID=A0A4Q9MPE0_9APHY|nr:hypothetical protein BD311DRAFT_722777 [Dichomitus squalens]
MAPQPRPSRPRPGASSTTKPAGGGRGGTGGRPRPQLPAGTEPSSYPRTDPFGALNALRSLLSLLPSRLGACHLRLSPAEHTLALHLLTVVEPFVGLVPCESRRVLVRQPTEILDAVAFHVDSRRDLLALALSCRRLYDVVFPRHWEYRVVRAKASQLSVWHHLAVHRSLARNVRRLEVLDERAPASDVVVPRGIAGTDTDLESTDDELGMHAKQERFLLNALGRMSALQAFKWSCSHSLVAFETVWPALDKCAGLKEVEVNDNLIFKASEVDEESGRTGAGRRQQPLLHDLRKVGLHGTKSAFGLSKHPDLSHVSKMLHNCANLEALDISYVPRSSPGYFNPVADDFLLCGRWSSLRSLTLTNLWCTPHAGLDAAASFLFAHVNLEILHLEVSFGAAGNGELATFKFPPNCLPHLRELKANRELSTALLACPCDAPSGRPLETLKGVRLSGSTRDRVFLENLRAFGNGTQPVKRLELAGWNDMEDVRRLAECVPKLVWLDLGKRNGSGAAGNAGGSGAGASTGKQAANITANFVEWADVLAQMPELTTFHGLRFFYECACTDSTSLTLSLSDRSRVRKNDEVASVLAWKCPKLRRLDHWDDGSGRIIVLIRDPERVRYQVRRTVKV